MSWSYFPNHKGRVTGLIVAGYGFGASVFNLVATAIVNPTNASPTVEVVNGSVTDLFFDETIADRVPSTLRWLALIYIVGSGSGILLMGRVNKAAAPARQASLVPFLKRAQFWLLFTAAFCSTAAGLYVAAAYKSFGDLEIDDDKFLALTGSVASVFNGSFRFLWAQLMEKTSFRTTYLILLGLQITLMTSLYYVASVKVLFLIWVALLMCCEGGHFSLFAALFAVLYGRELGAKLYGVFFYTFSVAALLSFVLQFFLVEYVGYLAMFWVFAGLTGVSAGIVLKIDPEKPTQDLDEALLGKDLSAG